MLPPRAVASGFNATANGSSVTMTTTDVQVPAQISGNERRQGGGGRSALSSAERVAAIAYPSSGMNNSGRSRTHRQPQTHVASFARNGHAKDSATILTRE